MSLPLVTIHQNAFSGQRQCPWHRRYPEGKTFPHEEIVPKDCCPWLYFTIYPYFLAMQFGAKFNYNAEGDCHVGCPAAQGVDVLVRKRPYEEGLDSRITDRRPVFYAEVVKVHGTCPYNHAIGQRIVYPLCMNQHYLCSAGFHAVFPFLKLQPPPCIDLKEIRCPDWEDTISFNVDQPGQPG